MSINLAVSSTGYRSENKRNTQLQTTLRDHYESRSWELGDNSELLDQITDIAGNTGYSHEIRAKKMDELLTPVQDSLSATEKAYVSDLVDIQHSYLTQRGKRSGKLTLENKIKNFQGVTNRFEGLGDMYGSMSYEDVLRKYATSESEDNSVSESGLTSLTVAPCTSRYSDTLEEGFVPFFDDEASASVPRLASVLPFVDPTLESPVETLAEDEVPLVSYASDNVIRPSWFRRYASIAAAAMVVIGLAIWNKGEQKLPDYGVARAGLVSKSSGYVPDEDNLNLRLVSSRFTGRGLPKPDITGGASGGEGDSGKTLDQVYQRDIDNLGDKIFDLEDELAQANKARTGLVGQLVEVDHVNGVLNGRLANLTGANETLTGEVARLKNKLAESRDKYANSQKGNAKLQNQLKGWKAAQAAQAKAAYEANQIQILTGNNHLQRPAFPTATYTIDVESGVITDVETCRFTPLGGLRQLSDRGELRKYAAGLVGDYLPSAGDPNAFEKYVERLGAVTPELNVAFVKGMDEPGKVSALDKMVHQSDEYKGSFGPKANPARRGTIVRKGKGNKTLKVWGNKGHVRELLKSSGRGGRR
jgi:hypothetical protein